MGGVGGGVVDGGIGEGAEFEDAGGPALPGNFVGAEGFVFAGEGEPGTDGDEPAFVVVGVDGEFGADLAEVGHALDLLGLFVGFGESGEEGARMEDRR